jgi:hypothetical protein
MISKRTLFGAALLIAASAVSLPAFAYHGHHGYGGRVGIYIGPPVFGLGYYGPYGYPYYAPPYYGPSPYYYPPAVISPAPQTYIEQGAAPAPSQAQAYWYYCTESQGYYPYVQQCPAGWQKVAPQPPAPAPR